MVNSGEAATPMVETNHICQGPGKASSASSASIECARQMIQMIEVRKAQLHSTPKALWIAQWRPMAQAPGKSVACSGGAIRLMAHGACVMMVIRHSQILGRAGAREAASKGNPTYAAQ